MKKKTAFYKYPAVWMRGLYDWVIHWSKTPYAVWALLLIAFAESSFFPVPPDVLLIAMALSHPVRSFFYALMCSIGSVTGGIAGYAIGYFVWEVLQGLFIPYVFSQDLFNMVCQKYDEHSFLYVFIAAFTPIPYKVFTIAGGVCHINFWGFLAASVIGRSARFFMVSTFLYFFGKKAKEFIDKYFEWLTLAFAVLLVGGFFVIKNFL